MIVLFNMNDYLGGGETLLLRLGSYFSQSHEVSIISSSNSFISRNIDFKCRLLTVDRYDYLYMNNCEKELYLNKIRAFIGDSTDIKIVTFCLRDLYTLVDLSHKCDFVPFHLLLHPLDHLYASQSLLDKIILSFIGSYKFSNEKNMLFNKSVLNMLNKYNLLISMNENVHACLLRDFGINVRDTIPLPVFKGGIEPDYIDKKSQKITWVGRLVNFKLPAIYSMIDFLDCHEDYTFYIIGGGGDIAKVKSYMSSKNNHIETRVFFMGEVPYDKLNHIIRNSDIGYAMGTSIVEFGRYGIPTIVALASPNYKNFSGDICGGLASDLNKGNVGDDLYASYEFKNSCISECVNQINNDYIGVSKKTFDNIKYNFCSNKNSDLYFQHIINGVVDFTDKSFLKQRVISVTVFRRIMFRIFGFLRKR